MQRCVYVLSTRERAMFDIYKIGRHSGTSEKLLSRYRTTLFHPIIYHSVITGESERLERLTLKYLDNYRIINDTGRKSEWVQMKLPVIKNLIEVLK